MRVQLHDWQERVRLLELVLHGARRQHGGVRDRVRCDTHLAHLVEGPPRKVGLPLVEVRLHDRGVQRRILRHAQPAAEAEHRMRLLRGAARAADRVDEAGDHRRGRLEPGLLHGHVQHRTRTAHVAHPSVRADERGVSARRLVRLRVRVRATVSGAYCLRIRVRVRVRVPNPNPNPNPSPKHTPA